MTNRKSKKTTEIDAFDPVVYGSGELAFIRSENGKFSSLAEADEYLRALSPEPDRERRLTDFFLDGYDVTALAAARLFFPLFAVVVILFGIFLEPMCFLILEPTACFTALGFAVPAYYSKKAQKCDEVFDRGALRCAVPLRIKRGRLKTRLTYAFLSGGKEIVHSRNFVTDDDDLQRLYGAAVIVVAYDESISRSISVPVIPITANDPKR